MNILVGISGFGQGHTLRQKVIIDALIERGHTIVISAYESSYKFFSVNYSELKIVYAHVPFIACGENGINWEKTKKEIKEKDYFALFVNTCDELNKEVGKIDFVISDYEPICAWYAYAIGVPLITMEQQSKFLGFKSEIVNNFRSQEEVSRLRFFFPSAKYRLAASFFDMKKKENTYEVELVGPIIGKDVLNLKRGCTYNEAQVVVVYFSPFISDSVFLALIDIVFRVRNKTVVIFSKEHIDILPKSIRQYRYNREQFIKYLEMSSCVISTAGHQLISELILMEKPMLLYPIQTFEQQYNAMIVKKNGMGEILNDIDNDKINNFLLNLDIYYRNIIHYKKLTKYNDKVNNVMLFLEERMGI